MKNNGHYYIFVLAVVNLDVNSISRSDFVDLGL